MNDLERAKKLLDDIEFKMQPTLRSNIHFALMEILLKKKLEHDKEIFVFDSMNYKGDEGDNSKLWKKAKILKIYFRGDWLTDVQLEDGRISKGHFLNSIEKFHPTQKK